MGAEDEIVISIKWVIGLESPWAMQVFVHVSFRALSFYTHVGDVNRQNLPAPHPFWKIFSEKSFPK